MINKNDVVEGIYLKQITPRGDDPAGLVGVVHHIGTRWTGQWCFQLRYLNRPTGKKHQGRSPWSLSLTEEDLADFELLGTRIPDGVLIAALPSKPKKAPKLPAWMRPKGHPNQLRLFEDP